MTNKSTTKTTKKLKVCTYCNTPKAMSEFGSHKQNRDGKQQQCKRCRHQLYYASKNINKTDPQINVLFTAKKYEKIINHPTVTAYTVFDDQTLAAQFVISTQRLATAKNEKSYNRYLAPVITNLLALAQKTSTSNAKKILSTITTDKNAFNTAKQHKQVVQVLPQLKKCLTIFDKKATKAATPEEATTKTTTKATKATKTAKASATPKRAYTRKAKTTPTVAPKAKRAYTRRTKTTETTKATGKLNYVKAPVAKKPTSDKALCCITDNKPKSTLWAQGNIVLMKKQNKKKIVPVTIKAISANGKCFQSEKGTWYEIDQVEYVDFVIANK